MVDIWRIKNPTLKCFTWHRANPLQQTRIDFFLIPDTMMYKTESTDIGISYLSDHSVVNIRIMEGENKQIGKGYWKISNALLEEEEYKCKIRSSILDKTTETDVIKDIDVIKDKRLAWEYTKMLIRRETISYSINKRQKCINKRKCFIIKF